MNVVSLDSDLAVQGRGRVLRNPPRNLMMLRWSAAYRRSREQQLARIPEGRTAATPQKVSREPAFDCTIEMQTMSTLTQKQARMHHPLPPLRLKRNTFINTARPTGRAYPAALVGSARRPWLRLRALALAPVVLHSPPPLAVLDALALGNVIGRLALRLRALHASKACWKVRRTHDALRDSSLRCARNSDVQDRYVNAITPPISIEPCNIMLPSSKKNVVLRR